MSLEIPSSSAFQNLVDAIADRVVEKLKAEGFIKERQPEILTFQDGTSIDLGSVVLVDKPTGDQGWLSYRVMLAGGHVIEIFETRRYIDNNPVKQMTRTEFMKRLPLGDRS